MKKFILFWALNFCLYGCTPNSINTMKLTIQHSVDSLFYIEIPDGYFRLYNEPRFLVFKKDENGGHSMISIMKESAADLAKFRQIIAQKYEKLPAKFHVTTLQKNDTMLHNKVRAGLFNTDEFHFLIKGGENDYIINISSPSIAKTEAVRIVSSLKEH